MSDCLFCKMSSGEIPVDKVFEDEHLFVIRDIRPQAPEHVLIIPRRHVETILDFEAADRELVGRIYEAAARHARERGFAENGYRVVANCGRDGGQTVYHVHFHLLAGRGFGWPPG